MSSHEGQTATLEIPSADPSLYNGDLAHGGTP